MKGIQILEAFWRDSARTPRFLVFSAYIAIPLLMFLFHIRWWTFFVLVIAVAVMTIIEQFGFTPPVALLALRSMIAGKRVKRSRHVFQKKLNQ